MYRMSHSPLIAPQSLQDSKDQNAVAVGIAANGQNVAVVAIRSGITM